MAIDIKNIIGSSLPTGFTGSVGFTGSIGFTGSQGATGFVGSQGNNGVTITVGTTPPASPSVGDLWVDTN